jgi:hypothetical protein
VGEPLAPDETTSQNALAAPLDDLEFKGARERSRIFNEALRESAAQARAELADGPALFAMERGGRLFALALPSSRALLTGGAVAVDLASSRDPWPQDLRIGLLGRSELELAKNAASALVGLLGVLPEAPVVVEREGGAPFAAAFVDGKLRLNPALLYLAAAAEVDSGLAVPAPAERGPAAERQVKAGMSCAAVAGGPFSCWALAVAIFFRSRRRK